MRTARRFTQVIMMGLVALAGASAARAGWLSSLGKVATEAGEAGAHAGKAGKLGAGLFAIEDAAGLVAKLPNSLNRSALAAHVSPEGHWTFLNKQGDSFTAANASEMERLNAALLPDSPAGSKLALYLSEDSAFQESQSLKALPADAELHIVTGRDSYPLVRAGDSTGVSKAQIRPNLTVDLTSPDSFREAVYLLSRPLNKANVRMLGMEPGGPKQLSSVPAFDKTDKTTLVDRIDPAAVLDALQKVRGQTVIITGRVEGDVLYTVPSGLVSDVLSISKLRAAAEAADINLVVLKSASTRQPGGRSWLWQKVEVAGLKDALKQPTTADFFETLASNHSPLSVTATPDGSCRTLLQVLPRRVPGRGISDLYGPWAGEVADELKGNIPIDSVTAFVRDGGREQELDARIIPGIPSWIQILAMCHLMLGLVAHQIAWRWWAKTWPPEERGEYGSTAGYHSARIVRFLAFVCLFLPIAGGFAFAWYMLLTAWDALHAPVRWARTLRGWFGSRTTA
jgi:hypothetical protein